MSPVLTRTPVKQIKPRSNPCKSNRWQTVSGWWTASRKIDCFQWMWRDDIWNKVFTVCFFFFSFKGSKCHWGGDLFSFWLRSRCFCMRGTFEHGLFNWTHPNHIWRLPGGAKASGGNYVCLPFRRLLTPPDQKTWMLYCSSESEPTQ